MKLKRRVGPKGQVVIPKARVQACTSTLTWDEVVWAVHRLFDASKAAMQGRALLEIPNLAFISVDESIISGAQSLKEKNSGVLAVGRVSVIFHCGKNFFSRI